MSHYLKYVLHLDVSRFPQNRGPSENFHYFLRKIMLSYNFRKNTKGFSQIIKMCNFTLLLNFNVLLPSKP
jgi:hypothetical protein